MLCNTQRIQKTLPKNLSELVADVKNRKKSNIVINTSWLHAFVGRDGTFRTSSTPGSHDDPETVLCMCWPVAYNKRWCFPLMPYEQWTKTDVDWTRLAEIIGKKLSSNLSEPTPPQTWQPLPTASYFPLHSYPLQSAQSAAGINRFGDPQSVPMLSSDHQSVPVLNNAPHFGAIPRPPQTSHPPHTASEFPSILALLQSSKSPAEINRFGAHQSVPVLHSVPHSVDIGNAAAESFITPWSAHNSGMHHAAPGGSGYYVPNSLPPVGCSGDVLSVANVAFDSEKTLSALPVCLRLADIILICGSAADETIAMNLDMSDYLKYFVESGRTSEVEPTTVTKFHAKLGSVTDTKTLIKEFPWLLRIEKDGKRVPWKNIEDSGTDEEQIVWLYWPHRENEWAFMKLASRDEMIAMVLEKTMVQVVQNRIYDVCSRQRRLKESDRDVPFNGHSVKLGIRYDATRAKFLCYDCQQPERLRVPAEQFAFEAGDDPCVGSDFEVCSGGTFGGKVLCGAAVAVSMLSLGLLLGFWWRRKTPK
eukprot:GHVT01015976.1.p1 GENE.GHVT01015976.1~~GHVT01015976.1.p1  ORF type:complete len:532 (-),score=48.01 GHVT01015976.1:346-1941(-)